MRVKSKYFSAEIEMDICKNNGNGYFDYYQFDYISYFDGQNSLQS